MRTRLPWVLTFSQLTNKVTSTFKLGRAVVVVGMVGAGVVVGQGGPEHSAISSGSPGHCDVGWLCLVKTRYLEKVRLHGWCEQ